MIWAQLSPQEFRPGRHGVDNEDNPFAFYNTDLERAPMLICADKHHEVAKVEHANWIPICMQYILIFDPVLASTIQNHGIHIVKIT